MNVKLSTAILGAGIFSAGAPAFDTSTGPIKIDNVQTSGGYYQDADADINVLPASIRIVFVNQANATATKVVFVLQTNGYVAARFNDVGTFSKGVPIHHSFPLDPFGVKANLAVAVAEASFADGTVWQNPDVPR
jgi:hypothetical protein